MDHCYVDRWSTSRMAGNDQRWSSQSWDVNLSLHHTVLTQRDLCSQNAVIGHQWRGLYIKIVLTSCVLTTRGWCTKQVVQTSEHVLQATTISPWVVTMDALKPFRFSTSDLDTAHWKLDLLKTYWFKMRICFATKYHRQIKRNATMSHTHMSCQRTFCP